MWLRASVVCAAPRPEEECRACCRCRTTPPTPHPGNSLDFTDKCMAIMTKHEAAVKEMEAASVAWAASMFGVPLLAVKAITDIVDGDQPAHEEFLSNLAAAAQALQGVVPKVVAYIAGKQIQELY